MTSHGAEVTCPVDVLMTGEIRLGNHQSNNLYIVAPDGTEYFIGTLFRESYGDIMRDRCNRGIA
jgi:hypothetical protein